MPPSTYRLDAVAAALVERLEASRPTHVDDPARARADLERIATELVRAQARECRELVGDEAQASRLEREALHTFLPRYLRLALARNAADASRNPLFSENVLVRGGVVLGSLLLASVLVRVLPVRWDLVLYGLPFVALFLPEVRRWQVRRQYHAALQALVDDMGRVQDAEERLAPLLPGPDSR